MHAFASFFFSVNNYWYGWWSGLGSCLGEFAIVGVIWRKFNCHEKGCYRVGLHHSHSDPYILCRKHHLKRDD